MQLVDLQNTENDHVFIYFTDNFAPGFIDFQLQEFLVDDLIKTIKAMHQAMLKSLHSSLR
jgi:hypothetical protein